MTSECFFKRSGSCRGGSTGDLCTSGVSRIKTIIAASQQRGDIIHEELQEHLDKYETYTIKCHRNCVSSYTSKTHIKRQTLGVKQRSRCEPPPLKRLCRSDLCLFDFKLHCLFCGEICTLEPDPRNPSRWKKAYLCRTASRGTELSFKDSILKVCGLRGDEWANRVEVRLQGSVSDLHAAEARYHDSCRKKFMVGRITHSEGGDNTGDTDCAFDKLLEMISRDKSKIWTSSEVHTCYTSLGGTNCRKTVFLKLQQYYGDTLVCFSAPGLSSLLVFRDTIPSVLRLVEDEDDEVMVRNVSRAILRECKGLVPNNDKYTICVDKETCTDFVSATLHSLLENISDNLKQTLPSIVIGNIITKAVTNRPTPLQVGLGVTLHRKQLIEQFHDLGICCSYDEVLRFKASAAMAASRETQLSGINSSSSGLVQAIADNFDANISSPNGLKSTHSLALLMTQPCLQTDETKATTMIERLKKENVKESSLSGIPVSFYNGPKHPEMPESVVKKGILPLKVLAQQQILVERSKSSDFDFLKSVVRRPSTPEFGGFNTRNARNSGQGLKPSTKAVYRPLIDMTPSDPSTMKTAMLEAKRLTKISGQTTTLFTADLQLYRVGLHVQWVYPELFGTDFILRLGGMHFLMSFVGAVGVLMAGSGLEEIMSAAFAGVPKMLTGKKFPQNTRALRITVEEILHEILCEVNTFDELMQELMARSQQSKTTKHWVENLIIPVLLMMVFIRAEREGEWSLHLWAVNEMMPYFFAAGHINYARYGLIYLRSMQKLHGDVLDRFLKGEHVQRHKQGLWNGIWTDMFIETTFMRYGHGPNGLIGITLNEKAVHRWALSLHICSRLLKDIADLKDTSTEGVTVHKEEMESRIKYDETDRQVIREKLSQCIDPMKAVDHPSALVNIVSGRICSDMVNVHNAVDVGKVHMQEFEESWPDGFGKPLKKRVTTMKESKKHSRAADSSQRFESGLIFARVMALINSRDVNVKDLMSYGTSSDFNV